ncbi:MAG: serine hydrolase, partial [Bacteroidota bacterium]|nr:serine hydrolase [Bacteroidota bacterium]
LQNKNMLPLQTGKKIAFVGFGVNTNNAFSDSIKSHYNADVYWISYKDSTTKSDSIFRALQNNYDAIVVSIHGLTKYPSHNFGLSQKAVDLMNKIVAKPNVVTFLFGNPYAIKNVCNATNLVACYEDDIIFQQQAFKLLKGTVKPNGTLPVTVCEKYAFGSGIL